MFIELEIARQLALIDVIFAQAQFFGIIAPVMRGDLEIRAFRVGDGLERRAFPRGLGARGRPDLVQQIERGLRRARHRRLQLVIGEGRITQQIHAFVPQRQDFGR